MRTNSTFSVWWGLGFSFRGGVGGGLSAVVGVEFLIGRRTFCKRVWRSKAITVLTVLRRVGVRSRWGLWKRTSLQWPKPFTKNTNHIAQYFKRARIPEVLNEVCERYLHLLQCFPAHLTESVERSVRRRSWVSVFKMPGSSDVTDEEALHFQR